MKRKEKNSAIIPHITLKKNHQRDWPRDDQRAQIEEKWGYLIAKFNAVHYVEAKNAAHDGAGDDPHISPFTRTADHFLKFTTPFPSQIELL